MKASVASLWIRVVFLCDLDWFYMSECDERPRGPRHEKKKHCHQSSIVSLMHLHASVERRSGLRVLHKMLYDSREIRKLYKLHIFLTYGLEVYLLYWYWWLNRSSTRSANMAVTAWLWTSGQGFSSERWDSPKFFQLTNCLLSRAPPAFDTQSLPICSQHEKSDFASLATVQHRK